ncbi:MAG: GntR family transcriptional regulator [Firmicutes bacterium]|nr:GntR family transcriptional regulator [Bacillota bacterium]
MTRSGYPLYLQLKLWLLNKIESGEWHEGMMIPTESELIEEHGMSRTTVRQALQDLVASGHLVRQQGRGTFVARALAQHTSSVLYGFIEDLERTDRPLTITPNPVRVLPCTEAVAVSLHLTTGTLVLRISRTVTDNGMVIYADESYIPESLLRPHNIPEQQLGMRIYQTLEAYGIVIASGDQAISAEAADEHQAKTFCCKPGDVLLRVERVTRDGTGQPIEYAIARYRADQYAYQVRLMRASSL